MYVEIRGLTFRYKNAAEDTIRDFTLSIAKGEIIGILGESGSGKTTILRLIAGLEIPSRGSIRIDGRTIVDEHTFLPPERRGVGMVFQDYALFPHMTVEANIKFGLHRMDNERRNRRLEEVLRLVNLEDYKRRYPHELSGGQQQRVALARALAPEPSLLLLDEPFSNLDRDLQYRIREELKVILKGTGITSIFVTHDREDSKALADRVVILRGGRIAEIGDPKDVLR